ncbi:Hsp20/alpha crystallin family protein [Desulfosarcina sp. OttesenSCG-928-G10]|nr:Hsp20/alpha crystallin family protein [Desulfosarcina sp. OttesenSCG-928-G10]
MVARPVDHTTAKELPGVDEKDVSVNVNKSSLAINGEKKKEFEDTECDTRHVRPHQGRQG